VLIDEHNQLIAGNGVVDACADVGITKVRIIDAEGDELIAVRRSNLTEEQKRKAALYDNRTSELSTWVPEQLVLDVEHGADLTAFFTPKELAKILKTAAPAETMATTEAAVEAMVSCPACGHTFKKI